MDEYKSKKLKRKAKEWDQGTDKEEDQDEAPWTEQEEKLHIQQILQADKAFDEYMSKTARVKGG